MLWILVLAFVGLCADNSLADPRTWDLNGVSVRQAYGLTWNGQTAQADDGSVLAIWTDARNGNLELFGQLLSPSGEPQWGLNGRLLAHTEGIGIYWPVITYSSDGWVVLWQDADAYNTSEEVVIHGRMKTMKFSSTGASLWNDPDQTGLMLYDEQIHSLQEDALWVESDGSGGAYCCWINETYFYAQRVASDGTIAWTNPIETNHGGDGWGYSIDRSSDGALLYAWKQHPSQYEILCNKINTSGNNAWTSPALVCRQSAFLTSVKLLADSSGGACLLWLDERTSEIADFYWRNVDATGQPLGSPNGHLVYTPTSIKSNLTSTPSINNGVMDGVLISWSEETNGSNYGYAQKVDLNGNLRWGEFPIRLCDTELPDDWQTMITITTDNAGGGICAWSESNGIPSESRIKIARLDSNEVVWDDCAVTVGHGFDGEIPRVVVAGDNILSIWRDVRNPSGSMFVNSNDFAAGASNFPDALGLDDLIYGDCYQQDILPLPNGRTVVSWQDSRLDYEPYFQILDVTGSAELQRDGIKLVEGTNIFSPQLGNPFLCEDRSGGFFAVIKDFVNGMTVIRATRWNSNGVQIGPDDGVIVSDSSLNIENQGIVELVPDGIGGAFIAYMRNSGEFGLDVDLYVNRIDENCLPMWDDAVQVSENDQDFNRLEGLVTSENGSCIVVWRNSPGQGRTHQASRIHPNGTIDWTILVAVTEQNASEMQVASDLQGGLAVTWADGNLPNQNDVYVQHIDSDGTMAWVADGLPVAATEDSEDSPQIAVDSQGNLIVAWLRALQQSQEDILAQKITPTGEFMWPAEGKILDHAQNSTLICNVIATDSDNLYFMWSASAGNFWREVYVTHLNAEGVTAEDPFWIVERGSVLCDNARTLGVPRAIATDDGSVVAVWAGSRSQNLPYSSIYAQRIYDPNPSSANEKPVIPTEFSLAQNYPNPFNPETVIEFALPTASKATLKVFDVTGRLVATLIDESLAAGVHRANFDAARLASGVYFYRLDAAKYSMTRKMVVLK